MPSPAPTDAPLPLRPSAAQREFDDLTARSAVRSLLLAGLIVTLPVVARPEAWPYYASYSGLLVFAALVLHVLQASLTAVTVARLVLVVGATGVAAASWLTGGAHSPSFHAYVVALVGSVWLVVPPRGAVVLTAAIVALGGALAYATAYGLTPPPLVAHDAWSSWLTTSMASSVMAVIQWLELRRLRASSQLLQDALGRSEDAQHAAAASQRRNEEIVSTVPGVVYEFEVRPDGRRAFTFVSERARQLFELTPAEIVADAETLFGLVDGEGERARLEASIAESFATLSPWEIEGTIRTPSGVARWVRAQSLPARLPDGTVRWHGVISDMTQRIKAERALQESQAALKQSLSMLQGAFESTADGLLVVDTAGRVTGYNQKFLALWRVPDALARTGDDARLLDHVLDQLDAPEAFLARVQDLYARPQAVSFDVLTFKDGRCYERYSQPQIVDAGVAGRVWSFRDVSARVDDERRRADLERALQQAHTLEALGTLAGGIAHDFNNVLTVILANAEHAAVEADPGERAASLTAIQQAAERAGGLVREIREFSQPRTTDRALVAVCEVIGSAVRLLQSATPKHITIEVALAPGVTMYAAATQVQQVVTNLVLNASQALGDVPGRITVQVDEVGAGEVPDHTPHPRADRYARLMVADTGPGIAADVMPRLFQPFYTTRAADGGSGLGLAVVQGIVRRYHGAIAVESRPGEGTVFRVYWPALPPSASVTAPDAGATDGPRPIRGANQHVFVVDDEDGIVRIVATTLQRLGYRATAFTDPREALARFAAAPHDVDLVLSDLSMPHLSGAELGRRMLDLRPDLPVLLFTGYAADLSPDEARAAGFRAVLNKPMTAAVLAEALYRALTPSGATPPAP